MIKNEIFRALGYLFIAYIAYFSWKTAYDAAVKGGLKKTLLKGFLICAGIALFSAFNLGSHSESCDDPIYGSCERVQDYEPTNEQRFASFIYFMTLLYLPAIVGTIKGNNEFKFKKNNDLKNDSQKAPKITHKVPNKIIEMARAGVKYKKENNLPLAD